MPVYVQYGRWIGDIVLHGSLGESLLTSYAIEEEILEKFEAGGAATTLEEYNRIAGELNQYGIEKFWTIWGPMAPQYLAVQPWIIGFNAKLRLGNGQYNTVFTRLWIDQDLKEMGH